jgi:carbamoyl-phosphate synthase large subunit
VQYAVRDGAVYVLEANPRASRTVPFCSKVIGVPLTKVATWVMLGSSLRELREQNLLGDVPEITTLPYTAVKEAVMPFGRFPGFDILLGPEMRSTGEVMGIDADFGRAFAKAEEAAGAKLPKRGAVFISMQDADKEAISAPAKRLTDLGFDIYATVGTAKTLREHGVPATAVAKIDEGKPDVVDLVYDGKVDLVLNTQTTSVLRHHRRLDRDRYRADGYQIRTAAVLHGVPCITTLSGAVAAVHGIEARAAGPFDVRSLQEHHKRLTGQAR